MSDELKGHEPMQCQDASCVVQAKTTGTPILVAPQLGETELSGRKVPAVIWQHGDAFDGEPHWRRTMPLRKP